MLVKSNLPVNKVALWERHPDHPNGEVFIVGEDEYEVAETPQVKALLKRDILVEVVKSSSKRTSSKRSVSRGDSDE